MDLSASSRLITSALTSLEVPLHDYEEDVRDEIVPDRNKDDNGPSPAAHQGPSKDQQLSISMDSSLIIPVPGLHFNTSTPSSESHGILNGSVLGAHSGPCFTPGAQDNSLSLVSPSCLQEAGPGPQDTGAQTTGDLVLAAISVMKGRKARPDTKRLCNWVHRKYGRSVQEVVNEIDNLCDQGILEKVEYKGSISFRVVSDKKLHKRAGRRKSNNVNQSEAAAGGADSTVDRSKNETPKKTPGAAKKPAKKILEKSPETSQPLTVNFLVTEQMNPAPEAVVSKNEIITAIETSSRPINKKNVFRDLETILAQEIHLGYLKKVNDDGYSLPTIDNSKTYRGTIALKVSKRKPKPTQKALEMEAESPEGKVKCEPMEEVADFENNENKGPDTKTEDQLKDDLIKEKLISNKLFRMKNKIKATKSKMRKDKMTNGISDSDAGNNDILHEKQINGKHSFEEVLEEELSKDDDKSEDNLKRTKKKKETWQTSDFKETQRKNIFAKKSTIDLLKRKRKKKILNGGAKSAMNGAAASKLKSSTMRSRPGPKPKVRPQEPPLDDEASSDGPQRTVSARKKRARKIFDPADHDPPQRAVKRTRTASPSPALVSDSDKGRRGERAAARREGGVTSQGPGRRRGARQRQSKSVDQESDPDTDFCLYCDQGDLKNEKLITCKDCVTTVHPSCLNYPEDLTDQIYAQPWQCINCKTCFICNKAGDDDQMLFCDSCDLGYHMECHVPAITSKPQGRWECATCAQHTGFVSQIKAATAPASACATPAPAPELPPEKAFEAELPPLPPGTGGAWQERGIKMRFCPLTDLSPADWESLPVDESIPDIKSWSPARVSQYLVQNGIQETHAKIFFDEELDGSSVLVMQRRDIISGLGLKLGPALKIYNRVRTLQLRRKIEMF